MSALSIKPEPSTHLYASTTAGMSSHEAPAEPQIIGKGKKRAFLEPTEQTPLLGGTSQASPAFIEDASPSTYSNRPLWSKLTTVFLLSFCFCVLGFVLAAVLAWSYAARVAGLTPDLILNKNLVFRGPDYVDVLNITADGGIWVNVEGRVGLDAGTLIGVEPRADDNFMKGMWKTVGRWGVRTLDSVAVNMTTIRIMSEGDRSITLAFVDVAPLQVPLTVNPPTDLSWLTNVSLPIFIKPKANATTLLHFLNQSWQYESFAILANVGQVTVRGGYLGRETWRDKFHGKLSHLRTSFRFKIPTMPGLPQPGRHTPLPTISDILTLQSFNISSDINNVILHARATVIDPVPTSFNMTSPPMSFIVSLPATTSDLAPSPIAVASVNTAPFTLTHPNITLNISGTVLPLQSSAFPHLSQFLSRYLSGEPNPILISSSLLDWLSLEAMFPAPNPRPQLLRNVTIRDMLIKPTASGTFLTSGTVVARIVLPQGMHVEVDVYRVFPDVLVFDGEVPSFAWHTGARHGIPPEPPLPDPLPEGAFGHLRPVDWLPSISVPSEPEDGEGAAYIVSAKVVDVPLQVLPGRQKEFREFVSKVVFGSGGAVAGILGSAAVTVDVQGLPLHGPGKSTEAIELTGLPFHGSLLVGKKSMLAHNLNPLRKILDWFGL